jgi:asparagine synthase (glutamine-hydrolysing)
LPPNELELIDERRFMSAVIDRGQVQSHWVLADQISVLHQLDRLLWHLDEPPIGYNMYLHLGLYEAAQHAGVRIFLDGLDGDTTVNHGVGLLRDLAAAGKWDRFAFETKAVANVSKLNASRLANVMAYPVMSEFARAGAWRQWATGARNMRRHFSAPFLQLATHTAVMPLMPKVAAVLTQRRRGSLGVSRWASRDLIDRASLVEKERASGAAPAAPLKSSRHGHQQSILSPLFQYALELFDKTAAAFSLEPRYPFFDRRLIEFCIGLPMSQRLSGGWKRMILRRAMNGILPPEVQWRADKQNLSPNLRRGLIHRDRSQIEEALATTSPLVPYADMTALRAAYARLSGSNPAARSRRADADSGAVYRAAVLARWLQVS